MQESREEELEDLLAGRLIKQTESETSGFGDPANKSDPPVDRGEGKDAQFISGEEVWDTNAVNEDIANGTSGTIAATSISNQTAAPANTTSRATTFAKVEKSLISLGFFTPSSRRIKDQKIKRISFVREIAGKKVEGTAEFHPSAALGLPITADQDKFLALQDIITNLPRVDGKISNPIRKID